MKNPQSGLTTIYMKTYFDVWSAIMISGFIQTGMTVKGANVPVAINESPVKISPCLCWKPFMEVA